MGRKPTGNPPGRPSIPVNPIVGEIKPKEIILDEVLYWISLQATAEEIAGHFRVSVDTLGRRLQESFGMGFAELYKRCDGTAKLSLRRYQFKLSQKNATMAIFLGKNWLGQTDGNSHQPNTIHQTLLEKLVESIKEEKDDALQM